MSRASLCLPKRQGAHFAYLRSTCCVLACGVPSQRCAALTMGREEATAQSKAAQREKEEAAHAKKEVDALKSQLKQQKPR